MTHRTKVLARSMSRRLKIAHQPSASEREEENLASQKTTCDGDEKKKPAKRNAAKTTKTSQPRKKSKVSIFFTKIIDL